MLSVVSGKVASANASIFFKVFKSSALAKQALPSVFLTMGTGGDHSAWKPQIDHLANLGYQVVAFDNRGTGRTESKELDLDFNQMARDVEAVREELNVDSFHGISMSLGSVIMQHYGSLFPERLKSLQLHVTLQNINKELDDKIGFFRSQVIPDCYKPGVRLNSAWGHYNKLLAPYVCPPSIYNNPLALSKWVQIASEYKYPTTKEGLDAQWELDSRIDSSEEVAFLGKTEIPILVTVSSEDRLVTPDLGSEVYETLRQERGHDKNLQFVEFESGCHLENLCNPKNFNKVCSTFLSGLKK